MLHHRVMAISNYYPKVGQILSKEQSQIQASCNVITKSRKMNSVLSPLGTDTKRREDQRQPLPLRWFTKHRSQLPESPAGCSSIAGKEEKLSAKILDSNCRSTLATWTDTGVTCLEYKG